MLKVSKKNVCTNISIGCRTVIENGLGGLTDRQVSREL